MSEVFFTSDTHFGHRNIIKYSNRPFDDIEEMNEKLIENWNSVVGKKDLTYHLGDFAFARNITKIRSQLNGKIILIEGNHDKLNSVEKTCFSEFHQILERKINRQKFIMSHLPLMTWPGIYTGTIHLCGHTHGRLIQNQYVCRDDVSCDGWNLTPIPFDLIMFKMSKKLKIDLHELNSVEHKDYAKINRETNLKLIEEFNLTK